MVGAGEGGDVAVVALQFADRAAEDRLERDHAALVLAGHDEAEEPDLRLQRLGDYLQTS